MYKKFVVKLKATTGVNKDELIIADSEENLKIKLCCLYRSHYFVNKYGGEFTHDQLRAKSIDDLIKHMCSYCGYDFGEGKTSYESLFSTWQKERRYRKNE